MAISTPQLFLSPDDKELLRLLAQLLVDSADQASGNIDVRDIALSDQECLTLLELLERFTNSKKFLEGSFFIESLLGCQAGPPGDTREIFFKWNYGASLLNALIPGTLYLIHTVGAVFLSPFDVELSMNAKRINRCSVPEFLRRRVIHEC